MLKTYFKILIAVLFLSAAFSAKSYAGDDFGSPEEKAAEWATWLSNKVALTSTQYTQVYDIYLKYAKLYKEEKDAKGKVKGGYKPYRKKANGEIIPLLTTEQQKKWNGK